MNFPQHLQDLGMFNHYPRQTFQPAPQHCTTAARTNCFVRYPPQQRFGSMASTDTSSSFFADGMYHHRDEQAMFEEMIHQPLLAQPVFTNFTFRPLLPLGPAPLPATVASPRPIRFKTESIEPLVTPGVLGSHVDNAQYAPVPDDDWKRASFDYAAASSPASVETHTTSPLTPATDHSSSFTEHFLNSAQAANNSVAQSFINKQRGLGFGAPGLHPGAMPFVATVPPAAVLYNTTGYGFPPSHSSNNNNLPGFTGTFTMQEDHTREQGHYGLPMRSAAPNFQQTAFFDPREIDQTFEGEQDAQNPSESEDRASMSSIDSNAAEALRQQLDSDEFLLVMRGHGIPYKDIKRLGRYREADSTLRGRYRVLTKQKGERVRKPEWTDDDEALLREAVTKFTGNPQHGAAPKLTGRKVPWKQVSKYIKEHGGSYLFAPATCAKKWESL